MISNEDNNSQHFARENHKIDTAVIRFVGDSGDGMQLTGTQFSDTAALFGNDVATFPNYPSEIRAPQGSLYGVSGFQVQFGSVEVSTPGDELDLLVAMNPAGLKTNLFAVKAGGTIIVDTDAFNKKNLEKAKYETNPLEDDSLNNYRVIKADISALTRESLKDLGLDNKSILRSKNMFTLGMVYFMYNRSLEHSESFLNKKFKSKPIVAEANIKAIRTGFYYAETLELMSSTYIVEPAKMEAGTYRVVMGNDATAWGFIAAAEKAGLDLFLGSYPITPATDILHELVKHRHFGIKTFQAEDEIAGIASAIGASFAGSLAITTTSGPGLALKSEAIGLAMIAELPIVIVDVQRGGPSTGLPTKTEQSDLLQAMYGRNGESPVIVIAASTPANCFEYAFQASKLALEHMTPVILLTDGFIANGSAPWKIQSVKDLPEIKTKHVPNGTTHYDAYVRDEDRLARSWAIPGTPGLEHRIGGLEKDKVSGCVNQGPENHEYMCNIRAEKVKRVADFIPNIEAEFAQEGDLLVVGWGGTFGNIHSAVKEMADAGYKIGHAQFNYINPLPKNTAELFSRYKKIVVCELNLGQLVKMFKSEFSNFEFSQYNKVQGLPFTKSELTQHFKGLI